MGEGRGHRLELHVATMPVLPGAMGPNWLRRKAKSLYSVPGEWTKMDSVPCVPAQLEEDSQTSSLEISLEESCHQALGLGREMARETTLLTQMRFLSQPRSLAHLLRDTTKKTGR